MSFTSCVISLASEYKFRSTNNIATNLHAHIVVWYCVEMLEGAYLFARHLARLQFVSVAIQWHYLVISQTDRRPTGAVAAAAKSSEPGSSATTSRTFSSVQKHKPHRFSTTIRHSQLFCCLFSYNKHVLH